jgi:hypothetical protein
MRKISRERRQGEQQEAGEPRRLGRHCPPFADGYRWRVFCVFCVHSFPAQAVLIE